MEKERKIIKEQTKDGVTIYHYSDFDVKEISEEIRKGFFPGDALTDCFYLISERFKTFLNLMGDTAVDDSFDLGIVLSVFINYMDKGLEDIADFIGATVGDIRILYKDQIRYNNFYDRSVAGLVFYPAGKKEGKKEKLNEAA